jgi:cytochrome c551/c552
MLRKKVVRWLGFVMIGLVVLFGLIQLVPYGRGHNNPATVQEPPWDAQTRELAKRACFDCHSNETVWPWYSNVAPVSWLVQRDVNEGRDKFNFSEWRGALPDEVGEVIQEGEMPPWFYVLMHPNAKLSSAEKDALIQGLTSIR